MDDKQRCQSCGMPLSEAFGNYGTKQDGTSTEEFCCFCFKDGGFTNPDQTLDEMIQSSVENMTGELGMPLTQANELANSIIPNLGRWKNE